MAGKECGAHLITEYLSRMLAIVHDYVERVYTLSNTARSLREYDFTHSVLDCTIDYEVTDTLYSCYIQNRIFLHFIACSSKCCKKNFIYFTSCIKNIFLYLI